MIFYNTKVKLLFKLRVSEPWKERKKEKMFIQIKNIWYYNVNIVFDGVGLAGFKSRSNAFLLA